MFTGRLSAFDSYTLVYALGLTDQQPKKVIVRGQFRRLQNVVCLFVLERGISRLLTDAMTFGAVPGAK